ncbi:hypothetical protein [Streptomyces sp. NBC_01304]|uniref:hypothetical protein n=1 Tax=Streptomyces sp. NBC_01304 TaxID=2903818 RepID=UPI002E140202|nr:hypothetical protein OG430_44570 [Streptomyces sp. NBC_01304]
MDTATITRHGHTDDHCHCERPRETGPLRPAARVRYEGSITRYRGRRFRAYACHCWRCWDIGELRYKLISVHGDSLGFDDTEEPTAHCVRRSSLIRL